ncbi:MAG: PilN domain-containing protein [Phycisphaerales bacterium]
MSTMFAAPGGEGTTSFLPVDYLQRKAESRANVVCLVLFGIVLFGVVGAFLVTNRAWSAVREQQRVINAEYTEQTRRIEQLKQLDAQQALMLEKAEIAATLNERVPRSILLAELVNRMPERLTLTELQIVSKRQAEPPPKPGPVAGPKSIGKGPAGKPGSGSKDSTPEAPRPKPPKIDYTLSLVGLAATDEAVADFQRSLKECSLLEKVDLVSAESVVIDEANMRKFRLEAAIRGDADARHIEPLQVPRLKTAMAPKPPGGAGTKPQASAEEGE